ncbi:MAG: DUF2520 domain-containing protein [Thermosipho sp. (in: Bacteria)]|nr:DUF2520 domain-containing protein [Thermosipho sp. (in: thermotogales)]
MKVNVAGLGKVSSAILWNIVEKVEIGYILSRDKEKSREFCKKIGKGIPVGYEDKFTFDGILLVGFPDTILPDAPSILGKFIDVTESDLSVVHFSGFFSSKIFPKEWNPSSVHPNCPVIGKSTSFKDVVFGIEGNIKTAKKLVSLLGGRYFIIDSELKMFYHLAAVLMSNFPLALIYLAEKLYEKGNVSKEMFNDVMESLLQNTISNVKKNGAVNSITGPIARDDKNVVEAERQIFCNSFPDFCELYDKFVQIIRCMKEWK